MPLADIRKKGESLRALTMVPSYPLAVKFYEDPSQFPEGVRRPRDRGRKWAMCQAWALSRTVGWTIGLTPTESVCPPCNILFGWAELESLDAFVDCWLEMGICEDPEAVRGYIESHSWLEKGRYPGIVFSPLQWTKVVPDVVLLYCNPAQAGVLITAYIRKTGKSFDSTFRSSVVCATCLIGTMKKGEPAISIPCGGEKGQAMSGDSELIFAFPGDLLGLIVDGLEANKKVPYGRIPTVPNLMHEPELMPTYAKLDRKLKYVNYP